MIRLNLFVQIMQCHLSVFVLTMLGPLLLNFIFLFLLRTLPEPLMTFKLHENFIKAASKIIHVENKASTSLLRPIIEQALGFLCVSLTCFFLLILINDTFEKNFDAFSCHVIHFLKRKNVLLIWNLNNCRSRTFCIFQSDRKIYKVYFFLFFFFKN